jgi:Leucine-rich repeat (LRR) protein
MKHLFLIIIILLLVNCSNKEKIRLSLETENKSQLIMLPTDGNQEKYIEIEQLAEPLILDGRPYVNTRGKAYRKDEAYLFEFLGCNFDANATIRWYSLEGIEQLFNLKEIQIYGENLATVDLTPLASLSNLVELFIGGNITHLPDLTKLENLHFITIGSRYTYSALESLDGIGAPYVRKIEIRNKREIDSLVPLNNLLYLEDIEIRFPGESEYKIADMVNLPRLKRLVFSMGNAKIDLQGIENMSALDEFWVSNCEPINIEGIGKLTNLKKLSLNLISPEPSLEFLRKMPNLSALALYANMRRAFFPYESEAYQILDVSPLASLEKLQRLECVNFIIKNISALDGLDALTNTHLPFINLNRSRLYDEKEKSRHRLVFDMSTITE